MSYRAGVREDVERYKGDQLDGGVRSLDEIFCPFYSINFQSWIFILSQYDAYLTLMPTDGL